MSIQIKDSTIEKSKKENTGVNADSNFSLDNHVARQHLCRKTSQNIHALSKVASYIAFDKK